MQAKKIAAALVEKLGDAAIERKVFPGQGQHVTVDVRHELLLGEWNGKAMITHAGATRS